MKKRIVAVLLTVCLLAGLASVAFAADPEESAAYIEISGERTYYSSVSLAVAAVSDGDTITLTADMTATVTVSREIAFYLETDGHTCALQAGAGFELTVEGSLYIFTRTSPAAERYSVNLAETENGSVTASQSTAPGGSLILLAVTPDSGWALDALAVTAAEAGDVSVTRVNQSRYFFRMPHEDVTVSAVFTAKETEEPVPDCPRDETCPASRFDDVDLSLWYHDGIHGCLERGLMIGTSSHTFEPEAETTRAMLVTVLFRMEGAEATGKNPFSDVPEDAWYTAAVTWAAANRITEGDGSGHFEPEAPVTREQMAVILWRYAAYKGFDVSARGDLRQFTDGNEVSYWAEQGVSWAVGEKLLLGMEDSRLCPQSPTTRAQFAAILLRFLENVAEKQQ